MDCSTQGNIPCCNKQSNDKFRNLGHYCNTYISDFWYMGASAANGKFYSSWQLHLSLNFLISNPVRKMCKTSFFQVFFMLVSTISGFQKLRLINECLYNYAFNVHIHFKNFASRKFLSKVKFRSPVYYYTLPFLFY